MLRVVLIAIIWSISLSAYSLEFKLGGDFGAKSNQEEGLDLENGYNTNIELYYGNKFKYGFGIGYYSFGDIESSNADYNQLKYLNSTSFYGAMRYDIKLKKLNPYIKSNLGFTGLFKEGSYFDSLELNLEKNYITKGYDNADIDLKLKPHLFFSIGGGIEYKRFLLELVYEYIRVGVDGDASVKAGATTESLSVDASDISIEVVSLKFGYRFDK